MTRREIRENIFKMLFRVEFHDSDACREQLELFEEELNRGEAEESADAETAAPEEESEDVKYIRTKCSEIMDLLPQIDELINMSAKGWKTTRMGKVDLTIIRLAVYEMKWEDAVPVKVAINEAVELAKKYGTDDSSSFVNGVLANVLKTL